MPRNRFIQDRIDDGSLVLYHDYRSGSLRDWSGNGRDGTATAAVQWDNKRIRMQPGGYVSVPDSAAIRPASCTISVLVSGGVTRWANQSSFSIYKWDGIGAYNYTFLYSPNANQRVELYTGGVGSFLSTNLHGRSLLSVDFTSNSAANFFADGVLQGALAPNCGVVDTASTDPLHIGGIVGFPTLSCFDCLAGFLLFNRRLTATEHALQADALRRLD